MNSINPSDGIPHNQNKIIKDILSISLDFELIPHNLRNRLDCCFEHCKNIPAYYLKGNSKHVIGKYCNSCKELQDRYRYDSRIIQPTIHKRASD